MSLTLKTEEDLIREGWGRRLGRWRPPDDVLSAYIYDEMIVSIRQVPLPVEMEERLINNPEDNVYHNGYDWSYPMFVDDGEQLTNTNCGCHWKKHPLYCKCERAS